MRLGGIGIATVNVRAWDGSTWQNLPVQSSTYPNLRVALYHNADTVDVFTGVSDAREATKSGLCTQSYIYGFNGSNWDRMRSDPNKHLDVNIGGLVNLAHSQASISATKTTIKAANTNRKALTIKNIGTNDVYIGGTTVTAANGFKLGPGEALCDIRTTAEICGICATGETTKVCYWEE